MDRDSLVELPADSRREIVAEVSAVLAVDAATAEDLVRSAEPLTRWSELGGSSIHGAGRVLQHLPARLGVHSVGCGSRLTARQPRAPQLTRRLTEIRASGWLWMWRQAPCRRRTSAATDATSTGTVVSTVISGPMPTARSYLPIVASVAVVSQ
jgi:hypothetical protein